MRAVIFVAIGLSLLVACAIGLVTADDTLYWVALGMLACLVTGALLALGERP